MKIETLKEVKAETTRFMKRLDAAIKRINEDGHKEWGLSQTKENGAVKRAAIDLKNELTRLNKPYN